MMKRKIYWMVRDQIARKIDGSVGFAVWDRAGQHVYQQVLNQVWGPVEEVRSQARLSWQQTWDQVRLPVWRQVRQLINWSVV